MATPGMLRWIVLAGAAFTALNLATGIVVGDPILGTLAHAVVPEQLGAVGAILATVAAAAAWLFAAGASVAAHRWMSAGGWAWLAAWAACLAWAVIYRMPASLYLAGIGSLIDGYMPSATSAEGVPVPAVVGVAAASLAHVAAFGILVWATMSWHLRPRARHRAGGESDVERGAVVVSAREAQRQLHGRKRPAPGAITLGGVTIPAAAEAKHMLMCGSTGTGKSQAIQRVLDAVRDRGGRAIVADSGGEMWSRYGRPGEDTLLNPFDARSAAWSPYAELRESYDADRIARAAIPPGTGSGAEWNRYGQTLLAATMQALAANGTHSVAELVRMLTSAKPDELGELLVGTPAAAYIGSGNMLGSIRGVIGSYLAAWSHLPDRGDFSVRDWVRAGDGASDWMFVAYRDDQMAMLRYLVSAWIDLALVEALSLAEDGDRQLWFAMDEADSLGRVATLDTGLAKLRKYGGRVVLGVQTIAQLRETYGRETAQTIASNTATKLLLRPGDHETAEYFSRELGDQDIARHAVSASFSTHSEGVTESTQRGRQAALLPSELMALSDLCGYLTIAAGPIARIELAYQALEQREQAFVPVGAGSGSANGEGEDG